MEWAGWQGGFICAPCFVQSSRVMVLVSVWVMARVKEGAEAETKVEECICNFHRKYNLNHELFLYNFFSIFFWHQFSSNHYNMQYSYICHKSTTMRRETEHHNQVVIHWSRICTPTTPLPANTHSLLILLRKLWGCPTPPSLPLPSPSSSS